MKVKFLKTAADESYIKGDLGEIIDWYGINSNVIALVNVIKSEKIENQGMFVTVPSTYLRSIPEPEEKKII